MTWTCSSPSQKLKSFVKRPKTLPWRFHRFFSHFCGSKTLVARLSFWWRQTTDDIISVGWLFLLEFSSNHFKAAFSNCSSISRNVFTDYFMGLLIRMKVFLCFWWFFFLDEIRITFSVSFWRFSFLKTSEDILISAKNTDFTKM